MDATQATSSLLDTQIVGLAHELAMGIREPQDILVERGISQVRWMALQADPHFQGLLLSKIAEWNAGTNTPARIKLKAAAMLELNLDQFQMMLADEEVPNGVKLQAAAFVAKLGGIGIEEKREGVLGSTGTGNFQVRIYMNGKNDQPVVIEGEAQPENQQVLTVD